MTRERMQRSRRARDDRGAALVEFSFVAVLLSLLVFGIINFGLILSFKQDMTRAAAEGARAGAVAFPASTAQAAADVATEEAVQGFNRSCDDNNDGVIDSAFSDIDGMTCNITVGPCPLTSTPGDCVTVELVYDYENHPLLAQLPIISGVLPDSVRDSSVARLNS